ncbi:MAG: hypothetical protein HZC01_01525 [Candidatus Kerfeldbacteria bacterium]|nr:hypothetical protein [Candidatus Kerfeldbacteria bacterium]
MKALTIRIGVTPRSKQYLPAEIFHPSVPTVLKVTLPKRRGKGKEHFRLTLEVVTFCHQRSEWPTVLNLKRSKCHFSFVASDESSENPGGIFARIAMNRYQRGLTKRGTRWIYRYGSLHWESRHAFIHQSDTLKPPTEAKVSKWIMISIVNLSTEFYDWLEEVEKVSA